MDIKDPTITKVIGGRSYALLPMAPMQALSFAPKVLKVIAGALAGSDIFESLEKLQGGKENMAEVAPEFAAIISRVDPSVMTDLMKDAMQSSVTLGDGRRLSDSGVFHTYFTQHPGDLMQVAVWAIWENSKHFLFEGGGDFLQRFKAAMPSTSQTNGKTTTQ